MFPKKIISSTCSDIVTMVKNYWTHVKEDPNSKIPHVKRDAVKIAPGNVTEPRIETYIKSKIHYSRYDSATAIYASHGSL